MPERLSPLDATFLELEQTDECSHMHIGSVLVFDPLPDGDTPSLEVVRSHLEGRLGRLPRYRERLSQPRTGGLAWPWWEPDERFDLSAHVRRARPPAPGGDPELMEWASDFFSHRLDRAHPLWEVVLVEGLAEGRWALGTKTHHCLVDGVGSVDVGYTLLDAEPAPAPAPAPRDATAPVPANGIAHGIVPGLVAEAARLGIQVTRAGLHTALHPREALAQSRAMAAVLVRDELEGAPACSLNVAIGGTRRLLVTRASLAEVKEIKRELGGTVNDVVLAACAGGLRELLEQRGEEPPAVGLRAMVPVNVRREDEHGDLGNRVNSLFVELPVAEPDPRARYKRVVARTTELKSGRRRAGSQALADVTSLAPPVVHATLARTLFTPRLFNLTITNVPGPQRPLYAFGARMREAIPLVPLFAEHAVGIAIVSYDGRLCFGLNADYETVPDLQVLAQGIEDALAELLSLVRKPVG